MRTESTAVANLIRGVQMRRLDSEPGDVFVFDAPAKRAPRPHYAHVFAPRPAQQGIVRKERAVRVAPRTRDRRWPLIVLTMLAGLGGVIGASYIPLDDDAAPAVVVLPAAPAAPAQPMPAVVPPPVPEATEPPIAQPAASPSPTAVHVVKHVHHVKRAAKKMSRPSGVLAPPAARAAAQRADTENPL